MKKGIILQKFSEFCARLFPAFCVLFVAAATSGRAEDIFWNNPDGGNWNVAANWSANRVPGSEDQVFITLAGNYNVTLDAAAQIAALTVGAESGTQTFTTGNHNLTLSVPFTNTGTVEMRAGTLNATALVTSTPESVFRFVFAGPSLGEDFGQFKVNGSLALNGEVEFLLANGFLPVEGQQFTIISAGSIEGTFAAARGNVLPSAVFLNPAYTLREVIVRRQDARPILQTGVGAPGSQFRLNGIAGQRYLIYATSDLGLALQDWFSFEIVTMPGSTLIDFVDPDADNFPHRFYAVEFVSEEFSEAD